MKSAHCFVVTVYNEKQSSKEVLNLTALQETGHSGGPRNNAQYQSFKKLKDSIELAQITETH